MRPGMRSLASAVILSAAAWPGLRPSDPTAATVPVAVVLTPDSISGTLGIAKVVAVNADMGSSGKSLGSYSVTVAWDSSVARLDSVRSGDFGAPLVNYVSGGEVRLTQVNTSGRPGAFSLAQLYYRFVSDSIGKRSALQLTVTELTATDFVDLRAGMTALGGVARILPATVITRFSPDSIRERVGFKYQIDLVADLAQAS